LIAPKIGASRPVAQGLMHEKHRSDIEHTMNRASNALFRKNEGTQPESTGDGNGLRARAISLLVWNGIWRMQRRENFYFLLKARPLLKRKKFASEGLLFISAKAMATINSCNKRGSTTNLKKTVSTRWFNSYPQPRIGQPVVASARSETRSGQGPQRYSPQVSSSSPCDSCAPFPPSA